MPLNYSPQVLSRSAAPHRVISWKHKLVHKSKDLPPTTI